jgi:sugar/nucleoside kinase (ribokinase family)
VCLGNALVDMLAFTSQDAILNAGLTVGGMTLIDGARASELDSAADSWRFVAGGSAANTAAGVGSLGGRCAFVGSVGDDEAGKFYAEDLTSIGVETFVSSASSFPTGVCHVFVTSDGQRSMATSLGAANDLVPATVDEARIERAQMIYMEGYLLDAPSAEAALKRAVELAAASGVAVSLSLSDPFVVDRHHEHISELVFGGTVQLLLGNEQEAMGLTGASTLADAVARLRRAGLATVITRGAAGAVAVLVDGDVVDVPAEVVAAVDDTTGAGDLFAAGCLFAVTHGASPEQALRVGGYAAAEVIGHLGARPAVSLAATAPAGLLDF